MKNRQIAILLLGVFTFLCVEIGIGFSPKYLNSALEVPMYSASKNPWTGIITSAASKNVLVRNMLKEAIKCSIRKINCSPVELEPHWELYEAAGRMSIDRNTSGYRYTDPLICCNKEKVCLELWHRNTGKVDELAAREEFFHSLTSLSEITYEIVLHSGRITEQLVILPDDRLNIKTSLESKVPWIVTREITDNLPEITKELKYKSTMYVLDVLAPPPYFIELNTNINSPYSYLFNLLSEISIQNNAFALIQANFKPVMHDWLTNMKRLAGGMIEIKNLSSDLVTIPMGDETIRQQLKQKSVFGNKFFAVSLRVLIYVPSGVDGNKIIENIKSFISGTYSYGDYTFDFLDYDDYIRTLGTEDKILKSYTDRIIFRPGFLLNPGEMSRFCCFVPIEVYRQSNCISKLNYVTGVYPPKILTQSNGLKIGTKNWLSEEIGLYQPKHLSPLPILCLGPTLVGKTYGVSNFILEKIKQGDPVIIIDPHDTLCHWVAERIPIFAKDKTIWFDLDIPGYAPEYNLIDRKLDPSVVTNHLIHFLSSHFKRAWGTNIEHVYRHAIYGLAFLNLKCGYSLSLSDLPVLLSNNEKGKELRDRLVSVSDNRESVRFWIEEFKNCRRTDLNHISNKWSELFLNTKVSKLFSQSDSKITIQDVIDNKKVLIVKLPSDDDLTTELAGVCLIEDIYNTVKSRGSISSNNTPVFFCVDELDEFKICKLIYEMPMETRKFGLVPWYILHQLDPDMRNILNNFGTIINFGAEITDTTNPGKEFFDVITKGEYYNTGSPGKAVAYFAGGYIADFRTDKLYSPINKVSDIIKESVNKYYSTLNKPDNLKQKTPDFTSWRKDLT